MVCGQPNRRHMRASTKYAISFTFSMHDGFSQFFGFERLNEHEFFNGGQIFITIAFHLILFVSKVALNNLYVVTGRFTSVLYYALQLRLIIEVCGICCFIVTWEVVGKVCIEMNSIN